MWGATIIGGVLTAVLPCALLAADGGGGGEELVEMGYPAQLDPAALSPMVRIAVEVGIVALVMAILLCLHRIMRGPHLADRVLATEALSMQVVGLVILLTIRLGTTAFFDVALVVAIIGFATTLAFAQYIGAEARRKQQQERQAS